MGVATALPITPVQAQENDRLSITTSPLPINLVTKPGQTVTTDLRVRTDGPNNETLQITLLKFSANNNLGQPRLADREPGDDYFDWVTFSEERFTTEPNVWKNIRMTIQVPSTAGLGYYYAVAFTRAGDTPETGGGAAVDGGAATLVLLDVRTPNSKREVDVVEFSSKRRVYEFLPAQFTVSIKNTGNIHLVPSGEIFIRRGEAALGNIKVNQTDGNILPGSQREFTVIWNDGWPSYQPKEVDGQIVNDKDGNPETSLRWDGLQLSKLRIGKYTADLLIVYDDGERDVPTEATLSFWVIPWRILGVILLIFALVGYALFTILRKVWRGVRRVTDKGKGKDAKHSTP
jgi:hypothetical protein